MIKADVGATKYYQATVNKGSKLSLTRNKFADVFRTIRLNEEKVDAKYFFIISKKKVSCAWYVVVLVSC